MENNDVLSILRMAYDDVIKTQSELVYIFGRRIDNSVKYGIINKYGQIVIEPIHDFCNLTVFKRGKHHIISFKDYTDNKIKLLRLVDGDSNVYKKQIYASSRYVAIRLLPESIVLSSLDASGGYIVIDYNGNMGSKREYLAVVEHKNSRNLLCAHFLSLDEYTKNVIRKVDILTSKGKVKTLDVYWDDRYISKYLATLNMIYSRGTTSIRYKTDDKTGLIKVYRNDLFDYLSSKEISRRNKR